MIKRRLRKKFLLINLIFLIIFIFSFSSMGQGYIESSSEIQEKLSTISDEEREVLEKMFVLTQEIESMDKLESAMAHDMDVTKQEIGKLETMIANETIAYERNRDVLEQILKTYQKSGAASYIEIILDSDSLTTFIRRLNILRDLTENTGKLLKSIELSKNKLTIETLKINEKLTLMKEQQKKLQETLAKKVKVKQDFENYLASLEEKRAHYQEYLTNFKQVWEEVKAIFPETIKTFSQIIEEGNLPEEAIKIRFSSSSIKGTIKEETFNEIIGHHPILSKLIFKFSLDKVEIEMPEKNIVLSGTFVIVDGQTLKFEVDEGTFYGMPLDNHALEELFSEEYLTLNLKPLLGKSILKSIKIHEKYIELQITPVLF